MVILGRFSQGFERAKKYIRELPKDVLANCKEFIFSFSSEYSGWNVFQKPPQLNFVFGEN